MVQSLRFEGFVDNSSGDDLLCSSACNQFPDLVFIQTGKPAEQHLVSIGMVWILPSSHFDQRLAASDRRRRSKRRFRERVRIINNMPALFRSLQRVQLSIATKSFAGICVAVAAKLPTVLAASIGKQGTESEKKSLRISVKCRIDRRVGEETQLALGAVSGNDRGMGMRALRLFRSGDLVTESGMYAVLHSTPHTLIQHRSHIEGDRFQECKMCPMGVWYRLEAQHVRGSGRIPAHAQVAFCA